MQVSPTAPQVSVGHDAVDIVVPVYGAADELERCLESLKRHTDFTRHFLVLVVDGPTAPPLESVVQATVEAMPDHLFLLRNPNRRGFVHSVNRGMKVSSRDVVLLNSDTEVTPGWVDGLQAAAHCAPDVATATPLSNNATICSVPETAVENLLPTGFDAVRMAALVSKVSRRAYPEIPVGVGVCLYIRREALIRVGLFDEKTFGLGYGEESEFCMRARRAGYRHVAADDTFIYHAGQSSFGSSRRERVASAHRVMKRLYPRYLRIVADFLADDPLEPIRQRIRSEVLRSHRTRERSGVAPVVLHIVHGWPPYAIAGTELYAKWLTTRQAASRRTAVLARISHPGRHTGTPLELLDEGVRVRLLVNHFDQRSPLVRNALVCRQFEREVGRLLEEENPDLVHVHHLAGHSMSLLRPIFRLGYPVVYQIQDWWSCCSRANLMDRDGLRCQGPGLVKCGRCLPMTEKPPRWLWNRLLYWLRGRLARHGLTRADALVAGSEYLVESLKALAPGLAADLDIRVLPYGVDLADRVASGGTRQPASLPLRCGFIGSILPHKGLHVAAAAFRNLAPDMAELHVWGDQDTDPSYTARVRSAAGPAKLVFHGRFEEADKARILLGLDLLLIPSLGLESFGLVAREALHLGTPLVASRCGAPEELLAEGKFGALVEAGSPESLRQCLQGLMDQPEVIDRWRGNIPEINGMDLHAEAIEELYAEILTARAAAL